ncbi:hypothetical protein LP420_06000 [Massilia sp. B-10]|nr:hypothetical protein LP420_06000 [Massilia sp. B-10]
MFANCSPVLDENQRRAAPLVRPLVLPPALSAKAPVWLQKDVAYQRAAAHFYSGRYADARTQFLAIAGDAASPWQPLGNYLAARSLIRSATALPGGRESEADKRAYSVKLEQARAELVAIAPRLRARQAPDQLDRRARAARRAPPRTVRRAGRRSGRRRHHPTDDRLPDFDGPARRRAQAGGRIRPRHRLDRRDAGLAPPIRMRTAR